MASILDALNPLFEDRPTRFRPPTLYGTTGTGKTSSVRKAWEKAEDDLERSRVVNFVHLNCSLLGRSYTVAQEISKRISSSPIRGYGESELLSRVYDELEARDEYMVLVLDDMDELIRQDKGRLLFIVTRLEENRELEEKRIFPILVLRHRKLVRALRPAVRSKLSGPPVEFPPYDEDEMTSIVEQRVDLAFRKGAVTENAVKQVSFNATNLGKGDARNAIALLEMSGSIAEQEEGRVTAERVRKAQERLASTFPEGLEGTLSDEDRLILRSLAKEIREDEDAYRVYLKDLYSRYEAESEARSVDPVSRRDFSDKVQRLSNVGALYKATKGVIFPHGGFESLLSRMERT